MRKAVAVLVLIASLVSVLSIIPAIAGTIEETYMEPYKVTVKGAEQGDPGDQLRLGVMYSDGVYVETDQVAALKWFILAVERFPESETEGRNLAVSMRDGTITRLTPAQVAEAKRLAREWKPKKGE